MFKTYKFVLQIFDYYLLAICEFPVLIKQPCNMMKGGTLLIK